MLSDADVERLFVTHKLPEAGRKLVRQIRVESPVRDVKHGMDNVRTRYISRKMERALYAESRTVELPALVIREHDKRTDEMWPQPCAMDIAATSPSGASTRVQHTPDLFLIGEQGFEIEEWREEARLRRLATDRPHHFFKDEAGCWHYTPVEAYLAPLGIQYRLRSADEHPRVFLANLSFLEDYSRENSPVVPEEERRRLELVLAQQPRIPHLSLIYEHKFKADHIFQLVLHEQSIYADLYTQRLDLVDELILYKNKVIAQADALLRNESSVAMPSNALVIRAGMRFVYQQQEHEVLLVGSTDAICRKKGQPASTPLPLTLIESLFDQIALESDQPSVIEHDYDLEEIICDETKLAVALIRLDAVRTGNAGDKSERTLRRWAAAIRGVNCAQERLELLMPCTGGNRTRRVPQPVLDMAIKVVNEFHNKPSHPNTAATYNEFRERCNGANLVPMCQSSFYDWIEDKESIKKRKGGRMAYQKAPIPDTFDYEQPIHGVLPHSVVYIDHTPLNLLLRGVRLPNLGKATLTIATDGACARARAFYVAYRPAGFAAVLMILRDYVRRWGRLPRLIVLDNAKEFHCHALEKFCDLFSIDIRWRRRSKPRDSTLVERALGATEQEMISSLDGNTICLKDPRMVSSSVKPDKFISWTLPALHGSLEHYLFTTHATRIHSRLGMRPDEFEQRLQVELGAREHIVVRFDPLFKLMTCSHSGNSHRVIDRQRGVFVDGAYYWNNLFATAKKREKGEVLVEMWCASVIYVCFRDQWIIAKARDGRRLEGRFRYEFEMQRREESRRRRTAAQNDKQSKRNVHNKAMLHIPEQWDARLREQEMEQHYLYSRLGMTEAMPDAKNEYAGMYELPPPQPQPSAFVFQVKEGGDPELTGAPSEAQLQLEGFEPGKAASSSQAQVPDEDEFF